MAITPEAIGLWRRIRNIRAPGQSKRVAI